MFNTASDDNEFTITKLDTPIAKIDRDPATQNKKRFVFVGMRMPVEGLPKLRDLDLRVVNVSDDMGIENLFDLPVHGLKGVDLGWRHGIYPLTAFTIFCRASSRSSA